MENLKKISKYRAVENLHFSAYLTVVVIVATTPDGGLMPSTSISLCALCSQRTSKQYQKLDRKDKSMNNITNFYANFGRHNHPQNRAELRADLTEVNGDFQSATSSCCFTNNNKEVFMFSGGGGRYG